MIVLSLFLFYGIWILFFRFEKSLIILKKCLNLTKIATFVSVKMLH